MNVWDAAGAVIVSLGGGAAIVFVLSSWLGKVWASRILEEDRLKYQAELEKLKNELEKNARRLQGEIEKTLFVHRLHFETEFRALCEIWQKVSRLRNSMAAIPGLMRVGETSEQRRAVLVSRGLEFSKYFDAAIVAVDEQRPFLTEEIHTELMGVLHAARAEHERMRLDSGHGGTDWYDGAQANLDKLMTHANQVVNLIRARLSNLALYPTATERE